MQRIRRRGGGGGGGGGSPSISVGDYYLIYWFAKVQPFIKDALCHAVGTDQDRGAIQFFHGRIKDRSTR